MKMASKLLIATLVMVHLMTAGGISPPYRAPRGSLVFDSTEGAAEFKSTMGLYEPRNPGEGKFPQAEQRYFEQKDGDWVLVFNDEAPVTDKYGNEVNNNGRQWQIQLFNDPGVIALKAASGDGSRPPTSGWTYEKISGFHFLLFSAYKEDPSLTVSQASSVRLPECQGVFVSSTGQAGKLYPTYMGQYTYNGNWKDGHPVFENEVNNMYLATGRQQGRWYIARRGDGSDFRDPGDNYKIASGRASLNPANPAVRGQTAGWVRLAEVQKKREELQREGQDDWVYYDQLEDLYKEDETFNVECQSF